MSSTHKVINQKLRSAKIICGKEFSIRGGVGESDLIFAQVGTENEVVPAQRNKTGSIGLTCFQVISD